MTTCNFSNIYAPTMLMTATEEDPRIVEQPSRNIILSRPFNIDSRKVKDVDYNQLSPTRSVRFGGKNFSGDTLDIQKLSASPKPVIGGYDTLMSPCTDKSCFPHDDGYSTDSKSNTSPSTISPLSSSFSSLCTFDGSFASHTPSGIVGTPSASSSTHNFANPAMTGNALRSSVPKHSLIPGNGKIHVNRHAIMAAKKKDVPQEMLDSPANLEDRLRALTTIEEEEPGILHVVSNDSSRTNVDTSLFPLHRSRQNPNVGSVSLGSGFDGTEQAVSSNSGCFRAVPVEVVASQISRDHKYAGGDSQNFQSAITQSMRNPNDKNWHDYKRYFEKDCDIPLHNIDFSNRNKFIGTDTGNLPDKDINRQLATNTPSTGSDPSCTQASNANTQPLIDRIPSDQPGSNTTNDQNFPVHQVPFRSHHHQTPVRYDPWDQGNYLGQHSGVLAPSSDFCSHSLPRNIQTSSLLHVDNPYQLNPQQTFQKDSWNSGPPSNYQSQQQQQMQRYQQLQMQQPQYQDNYEAHLQSRHKVDTGSTSSLKHSSLSNSFNPLPSQSLNSMSNFGNQRDSTQVSQSQEDVILRRSWAASSGHIGQHVNRSQNFEPGDKLNPIGTERYSLDLGNIPLLRQQIRATSEMCLQASKRHVFASSADIYKLFQGQKKAGGMTSLSSKTKNFPRTRDQSNRHSFHATPGSSWQKPQLTQPLHSTSRENTSTVSSMGNHSSLSANPPFLSHHTSSSPGPLRADHLLLPQMSWVNNLPPSSSSSSSASNVLPVSLSDVKHIQRQSSGYSSENELQQIEQNAKSGKNKSPERQQHSSMSGIPPEQKFVPVDPSLDQDSSSSIVTADNEPVYVNQPTLAALRMQQAGQKGSDSPMQGGGWDQDDSLSQPPPPSPPPPPLPARPDRLLTSSVQFDTAADAQTYPDPMLSRNDPIHNSRLGSSPTLPLTQHQVINLQSKPVTIRTYVPKLSYSNTNHRSSGQSFDQGDNVIGGHILTLNPPDVSPNQRNFALEHSSTGFTKGNNAFNSQRSSNCPRVQLSPLEIAQVLEVPFATSVISDESGDRLSTLV